MSFQQNRFLGQAFTSDIEELINTLGEKAFYRDGSKTMEGPIGMDGNNIIGPAVVELNVQASEITPAVGKISLYALASDSKLYSKTNAGVVTELGGGDGDVEYTGTPSMPSTNEICIFDSTDGLKIKNSEVQFPLVGGSSGQVLTLTGTGSTSEWTTGAIGDVTGAVSSTNNGIVVFDSTTGKIIKETGGATTITSNTTGLGFFEMKNSGQRIICSNPEEGDLSIGYGSGIAWDDASNTQCTALGINSQRSNIDCKENVSIGRNSLYSMETGCSDCVAVGNNAMSAKTSGEDCVAIGNNSQQSNDGSDSVSIGYFSMANTTLSDFCVAIGDQAMSSSTGGNDNVYIGAGSGFSCNGDNNTLIGKNTGLVYTGIESNNILIGRDVGILGDNQKIRIGASQTNTFIKGIYGITPAGTTETVIIDSNGEMGSAAGTGSVAYGVVQRSRTTDFTTDGNWNNIPHDTDLVTNTDLLSAAGTTIINVNQDGLVEISFQCTCSPPSDDETKFEARFRKNNIIQPAGNISHNLYQGNDSDKSDWSMINRSIILELQDGDWLGVQVRDVGGGAITLIADSVIFTAKYLG